MRGWSELADRVAGTSRTSEKTALLARYLADLPPAELRAAATFLSGRPFPEADRRPIGLGWAAIASAVCQLAAVPPGALGEAYDRYSDLGLAVEDVLQRRPDQPYPEAAPAPDELLLIFRSIAEAPAQAKGQLFADLLADCDPLSARYVVKILTGDLRIGLREGLLEAAIAQAFDRPQAAVQWAGMLTGDVGETAVLAKEGRLDEARLRLLHPIKFMLASPAEDAAEVLSRLGPTVWVEDKYDGIRAQLHRRGSEVRLFSRDLHDISEQFPEVLAGAAGLDWDGVLDGEILAFKDGQVLPFLALQGRLGRKAPSPDVLAEVPAIYVAFDLLAVGPRAADAVAVDPAAVGDEGAADAETASRNGDTPAGTLPEPTGAAGNGVGQMPVPSLENPVVLDRSLNGHEPTVESLLRTPLVERRRRLEALALPAAAEGGVFALSHLVTAASVDELNRIFTEARARRNEGLMVKDPDSGYSPGRRGYGWLKMKRALATLDCVVVGVEVGHGKRHGVLSDYTFAVRDAESERLVTIGKAYTGLTDQEIADMTRWFEAHTIRQFGRFRQVEPTVVVEVAFDVIQRSSRHQSGFALRFPRIVRLRTDKTAKDVDTLQTVERLHHELQHGAEFLVTQTARRARSAAAAMEATPQ